MSKATRKDPSLNINYNDFTVWERFKTFNFIGHEESIYGNIETVVNLSQVAQDHVEYSAGKKHCVTKRVRIPLRSKGNIIIMGQNDITISPLTCIEIFYIYFYLTAIWRRRCKSSSAAQTKDVLPEAKSGADDETPMPTGVPEDQPSYTQSKRKRARTETLDISEPTVGNVSTTVCEFKFNEVMVTLPLESPGKITPNRLHRNFKCTAN